jgi:streptomycin 6-kinase
MKASSSASAEFRKTLPAELVAHVAAICGAGGDAWLDDLSRVIAELEGIWNIKVGRPFPGIEFNFVAEAVMGSDPVVLKLAPPYERPEIFSEAEYLRHRNGDRAIRLLAEDGERHALMLERAVPGNALHEHFRDDPDQLAATAAELLGAIAGPPPADISHVHYLEAWVRDFRRSLETDFPAAYAKKALAIYERLGGGHATFYLHGDYHPGNIVTFHDGFAVIDPKGLIGHIGYDIAVFLNNLMWWRRGDSRPGELLADAIEVFSSAFGLAQGQIREWAYFYMVIGAWWSFEDTPELYDVDLAKLDVWNV